MGAQPTTPAQAAVAPAIRWLDKSRLHVQRDGKSSLALKWNEAYKSPALGTRRRTNENL